MNSLPSVGSLSRSSTQLSPCCCELRCPRICRERSAGEADCRIRACCIEKGFYACYECDAFETCGEFEMLEELHGDACVRNLRAIREKGLDQWLVNGERFWFGSDIES